jgi:nucleotidyltransferase substrate binding protein (TIGR01987 family)
VTNHPFPAQIRWRQRFENFDRTFALLREPLTAAPVEQFNLLEQQGLIQRFEMCFELAWKTIKDYMEHTGVTFTQVVPREIIKQAFAAKIILDGQVWIDMLEERNLLSHTYDAKLFGQTLHHIKKRYLPALEQIHAFLLSQP